MLNRCRLVAFNAFFATTVLGLALIVPENAAAQMIRVGPMGGFSLRTPMISIDTLPFGAGTRVWGPVAGVDTGAFRFLGPPVVVVPHYEAYPFPPPIYGPGSHLQRPYDFGYRYGYGYDTDFNGYGAPYDDGPTPHDLPGEPYASVPQNDLSSRYTTPNFSPPYAPIGPDPALLSPQPIPSINPLSIPPNGFGLNLHDAATRLEQGLAQREDGEIWLDYLRPRDILALIDAADPSKTTADLQTLLRNYEGVAGNQELSHVWVIDGFRQTHQGLKEWLDARTPMSVEGASQNPIQFKSTPSHSPPELAAPVAPAKSNPKVEAQFEELIPPGEPEPADDVQEQKAPAKKPIKKSEVQSL